MLKISHSIENFDTGHTEVKQTEPYIIFTIENEEFGVEARKVLELVNYMAPIEMPHQFANVQGMVSYRGQLIPIVDLRKVFGLAPLKYDDTAVTIVIESGCVFGITAERVLDLDFIPLTSIKKVNAFNLGEKTRYLKSVANLGERLVLLLDLDKMIETKSQLISEVPEQGGGLTKVEAKLGDDETKHEKHDNTNFSVEFSAKELLDTLNLEISKDNGLVGTVPELIIETRSTEGSNPAEPIEISGVNPSPGPDDRSDSQGPEALGNLFFKPGQEEAAPLANELESILAQLEQEAENEQPAPLGLNLGDGFQAVTEDDVQQSLSPENPGDGILEPEQIAEILSGLEADLVAEAPNDLCQNKTGVEIGTETEQTDVCLSDELIEDLLKELETDPQLSPNEVSSSESSQNFKADQIEADGEKSDV